MSIHDMNTNPMNYTHGEPYQTASSSTSKSSTIGRQVKACRACRQNKIKCIMPTAQPPCERCKTRGLPCERFVESSSEPTRASGVEAVAKDVVQLQTAVDILLRVAGLPSLSSYNGLQGRPATAEDAAQSQDTMNNEDGDGSLPAAPIRSQTLLADNNPYSLPVNSLYEVTRLPSLRDPSQHLSPDIPKTNPDFIARGVISTSTAKDLFRVFNSRLSFFCYGITCPHENLQSLRDSSPLLTAAVCTVAALHSPDGSATFAKCHTEFLRLISANMFSISYSVDDFRALVIGSWWLGNISYTLLGHAIRIATRLDYHLAFFSVVNSTNKTNDEGHADQDDALLKARLWYILFVMDHHSAVLYGHPALLSSAEEQHSQWEIFIRETGYAEVDLRITSQVALYHVLSKAATVFGAYSNRPFPEHCFPQLQAIFSEVDRWFMTWGDRLPHNDHVGWFPRDGAILSYNFAHLHLCSYVFRASPPGSSSVTSPRISEYASIAVQSAEAVLRLVLERDDLRSALIGMPIYYHGMINFAAVFLIKAIRNNFWGLVTFDVPPLHAVVQKYISELRSQDTARQHLVYHLAGGLENMMAGLTIMPTGPAQAAEGSMGSTMSLAAQLQPTSFDTSMFAIDTFNMLQGSVIDTDGTMGFDTGMYQ